MIGETQQQALENLECAGLPVDYIGEIFTVIMEGDTEIIHKALNEDWSSILKDTAQRFGRQ